MKLLRTPVAPFALLAFMMAIQPSIAWARGESSHVLPEVRQQVPAATRVVRARLWSRDLDEASAPHDMLAVGPSTVAFVTHGRVCGFGSVSGARLWCAGVGANPVFAGGNVAYAAPNRDVEVVDAVSGARKWQARGVAAWAAGNDFLIGDSAPLAPNQTMREYDRFGRVLWSALVPAEGNGSTLVLPPYAFRSVVYSGATMVKVQSVMRLGVGGGLDSELTGAWDILGASATRIVYSTSPNEEIQDHFITFDVAVIGSRRSGDVRRYHYEPDYDTNNALLASNAYAGRSGGPLLVEGNNIYVMFFGEKIYRYQLAEAAGQSPLLVSPRGQFLGGPIRGWLYVSRPDGVWALRPTASDVQARLVAPSASHISAIGDVVYLTAADQEVVGVDAANGKTIFDARPCGKAGTESGIGAAGTSVYIVCREAAHWSVTALAL